MDKKPFGIALNAVPMLIMISLIVLVESEYALAILYVVFIAALLLIKHERIDFIAFFFGLIVMTFLEYLFVNTGVEKFTQESLFGSMPLWLPLLWGYGFVAIRRGVSILSKR